MAKADREYRVMVERHGQRNMIREMWDAPAKFSALYDAFRLVLLRGLEGIKSVTEGVALLRLANALLKELNPLTKELIEFTKAEAAWL